MEGVDGIDTDRIENIRLSHPLELFSGNDDREGYLAVDHLYGGPQYCTAAVNRGLCYYLDCLRSISSDAETTRMVHIVPGDIQRGDKQFNHVYDISRGGVPSPKAAPVQADVLEGFQPTSIVGQARRLDLKIEMLGIETATDQVLMVYYQATISGGSVIRLQPGRISKAALQGTGILTCKHMHCTERLLLPCALVRQGWHVSDECDVQTWVRASAGPKCLIWPQMDDFARCVAIQLHMSERIVIRTNECIPCCTVSLVQEMPGQGGQELYHVM